MKISLYKSLRFIGLLFYVLLSLIVDTKAQKLSMGENDVLYICDDSTVSAIGSNYQYQLGDGTNIERHTPIKVKGLHNVIALDAIGTMALLSDGTIWKWTWFNLPTWDYSYELKQVPIDSVIQICAGYQGQGGPIFFGALKHDGSLWMWNYGIRNWNLSDTIKKITLPKVKAITAGYTCLMALCEDGTVWTISDNSMLNGNNKCSNDLIINKVESLSNIVDLKVGNDNDFCLKNDGTVWYWGFNAPNNACTGYPSKMNITNVKAIFTDNFQYVGGPLYVIKDDNTLWYCNYGNQESIFYKIPGLTDIKFAAISSISNSVFSTFAIDGNNNKWRWGDNTTGLLGNFTTFPIDSPEIMPHPCLAVDCDTITKNPDTLKLDTLVYPGVPVKLTASHSDADLYWWYPRSRNLSCKYCQTATVIIKDNIEYTAVIMDSYGCMRKEDFILRKKCNPNTKLLLDSISYPGAQLILTADTGSSYFWNLSTNLSCFYCRNTIATINDSETYTVSFTDTFNCPASRKFIIKIRNCDTIVKVKDTLMLDTLITPGKSVKLTASNAKHYLWVPSIGLSCDTCQAPIARIYDNTEFSVTITDKYFCQWTERFKLTNNCDTNTLNNPKLILDTITYPNSKLDLIVPIKKNYSWQPETGLSCNNCNNPIATVTDSIEYIATLTDSFNCVSKEKFIIRIRNCDTIEKNKQVVRLDTVIHYTTEIPLMASKSYNDYNWTPTNRLSCNECQNPTLTANTTSDYIVELSDAWRCPFKEEFKITMVKIDVVVPNVISPIHGINVYFEIKGLVPGSNLKIYDRNGRLVFSSENYQNNWNGKDASGKDLSEGTYWYILNVPESGNFKGWIYLKR
jgi:gliding motility-associated-like protein